MNRLGVLLIVLIASSPVRGDVHIWTGASSVRLSDSANWEGGSPAADPLAEVVFPPGPSRVEITNDISGLTLRSIAFTGSGYVIDGHPITLAARAEVFDSTAGPNAIECDLHLAGGVTVFTLGEFSEGGGLELSGAISGVGSLVKQGNGRATLSGTRANTFSGETRVLGGELRLGKADGIDAIAGNLTIGRLAGESGWVSTVGGEQIPDAATVRVGGFSKLGIGRTETIGPLVIEGGALVQTAIAFEGSIPSVGTLILGGDITVLPGVNSSSIWGDVALLGMRTITTCENCTETRLSDLRDGTPGSGLLIRGVSSGVNVDVSFSTYHGPTLIEGPSVSVNNPNTAVRLRSGKFRGRVASLVAEGGEIDATLSGYVSTSGDLRLSRTVQVHFRMPTGAPTIAAGGTLDLGGATLDFQETSSYPTRVIGNVYPVATNDGTDAIVGRFSGLPDSVILEKRYLLSYSGGDGNDLTLTETGRYETSQAFSAAPDEAESGEVVTLTARLFADRPGASVVTAGAVTFREGTTILATLSPDGSGVATTTVHPSVGVHAYTAEYSGSADLMPAFSSDAITVRPPKPNIVSVEPSSIEAGTTVDFIVRGSDFLPNGSVSVGSNGLELTYVSSSEFRFRWEAPRYDFEFHADLTYSNREPRSVVSNVMPILVRPLPTNTSTVIVEGNALLGPVAPGGGGAWLSIAERRLERGGVQFERRTALTFDSDQDGTVRWEQEDVIPTIGLWLLVDMTDGRITAGDPVRRSPAPREFPRSLFLRDPSGNYSQIMFTRLARWHVLWVRPHVGAWTFDGGDDLENDLDAYYNGFWVFRTSQMSPVGSSPAPPAGVEPGDTFAAIETVSRDWIGDIVGDHLKETDGPGALRLTRGGLVLESTPVVRVEVLRTGGTDGEVSVNYATANGTAIAGVHYAARAGTLRFGPGEILKSLEVPIIDDDIYSGETSFTVVFSNPVNTTIAGPSVREIVVRETDPAPQLRAESVTVTEGDSGKREVEVRFTITGATRVPVTGQWQWGQIPYSSSERGTFVIEPIGSRSHTITIRYDANALPEADRVFDARLFDMKNARENFSAATVTVTDDDPHVEMTILDAAVSESRQSVALQISLLGLSDRPVSVKYATASGTAVSGSDFQATSGTASFDTRAGTVFVNIPIVGDALGEGNESFVVNLSDPTNAKLRRSSATIVIMDDEGAGVPAITVSNGVATESFSSGVSFKFRIPHPVAHDVRFSVATADGTATANSDYRAASAAIVIPAGATDATFGVTMVNDTQWEATETFSLLLTNAVGATIATPVVTVMIIDNDERLPDPSFVYATATGIDVLEGNAGTKTARFTIRLDRASPSTLDIPYATADGSADSSTDYTAASGTLTFAPGETVKTLDLAVTSDTHHEPLESFSLVFGDAPTVFIATRVAECRIVDDDDPGPHRAVRH